MNTINDQQGKPKYATPRSSQSYGSPVRVTLSRRKGWRMPPNTVKVSRPSVWGNPFGFHPDEGGRFAAKEYFREWLEGRWPNTEPERRAEILRRLPELRGKNLACWCKPGEPCHANVLLAWANNEMSDPA